MISTKVIFDSEVNWAEVRDCRGNRVDGLPTGSGITRGRLIVIDLEPEANLGHSHLYLANVYSYGDSWTAVKWDWPPK